MYDVPFYLFDTYRHFILQNTGCEPNFRLNLGPFGRWDSTAPTSWLKDMVVDIFRYKSSYIESATDLQIGVLFLAIYAWILLKQYPCLLIDQVWIPNFNICFPGRWKSSPSVTIAGCRVLSLVFVLTPEADTSQLESVAVIHFCKKNANDSCCTPVEI